MSYCTKEEVNSLFGDVSDDVPDEMFTTAIGNSKAWIDANLKRNFVPIPTDNVDALKTVAIYHSASDIILSLYHGDEMQEQYDVWFNKAQSLLDDYISAYQNGAIEESDSIGYQRVKHSKGLTYSQKRRRFR